MSAELISALIPNDSRKRKPLITRATIDGGGEEKVCLYSLQAGTLNTFFSRTIARNGG